MGESRHLRLGYCNNLDPKFVRNLREVRRLDIPYGIYLYSYAANSTWAGIEADFVVSKLRQYNMTDMSFPVFYHLEAWTPWTWTDGITYRHPASAGGYLPVVNTFFAKLNGAGYANAQIYSYMSYLNNELNNPTILSKAGWVAQYNQNRDYVFPGYFGLRGWQYTSSGSVNGINGSVDMNAFGTTPKAPNSTYTGWVDNNGNRFYFRNGRLATNTELRLDGQWYYVNGQGLMTYNRVIHLGSSGGKWVYYANDGRMVKGEKYLNYDGDHTGWYYFEPGRGKMVHGDFYLTAGNKWVRYDRVTGIMVKGLQKQDGAYYYFDPTTGKRASGKTWVPEWKTYAWFDANTGKYTGRRATN